MGKLLSCVFLLVLITITSLLAAGCGASTAQTQESSTATTEPGAATSAAISSPAEGDISRSLLQHLINTAATTHGKQVLAKLLTVWGHGYGQEPFQHYQDGNWLAILSLSESFVEENQILQPIFENPAAKKYLVEWAADKDGLVFTPSNDNAKRLEAELVK
jgi:hypothetical protein